MGNSKLQKFFAPLLNFWAQHSVAVSLVALAVAIAFPLVFNQQYLITVGINCLMFSVLSLSLNLISGYMGITSLGHAAFFGVGAYTAAILSTRLGVNFLGTFLCGTVMAGIFGILLHLHMPLQYLIMMAISFGVSFAVTWVIWTPEAEEAKA